MSVVPAGTSCAPDSSSTRDAQSTPPRWTSTVNQASTVDAELSRTNTARPTPQSTVTKASGSNVGQLTVSSAITEVAVSAPTGEAQIRRVSRSTAGTLMMLEIAPASTTAGPQTNSDPRRISTVASRSEARLSMSTVTTPPEAVQACPVWITGSNPGGSQSKTRWVLVPANVRSKPESSVATHSRCHSASSSIGRVSEWLSSAPRSYSKTFPTPSTTRVSVNRAPRSDPGVPRAIWVPPALQSVSTWTCTAKPAGQSTPDWSQAIFGS